MYTKKAVVVGNFSSPGSIHFAKVQTIQELSLYYYYAGAKLHPTFDTVQ